MARTLIASDAFTGYTVNAFPTSNWTDLDGVFAGQVRIIAADGGVHCSTSGLAAMRRSAGTYSADQYSKVTITSIGSQSNDQLGCGVRCSADVAPNDDGYYLYLDDGATRTLRLVRRVNGSNTSLATKTGLTWGTGAHTVSLEVTGTGATVTLNGYYDDVLVDNFTNVADTDAARLTSAGRPGVICAAGGDTLYIDDWEGGDVTADVAPTGRGLLLGVG